MFFVFVFSVYIEKNPNPPLSLHIYNSRASARCSSQVGGGASHAHRGKGREGKGRRIRQKKGRTREEGRGEGACSFALTAWCSGLQTALDSNFQDRAVPTVPTWLLAWPSPSASSSASPPRAGPRLLSPQTTARNEILHSCQDKGRVGRER